MTDVLTYRQSPLTSVGHEWLAYVILPDGSLWGVRFEGDTEEAVRANAIALYEKEKDKWQRIDGKSEADSVTHERTDMRGQHLVGTVCMINHGLKQRMRCKAAEVPTFEAKGWVRGGPRTQFND